MKRKLRTLSVRIGAAALTVMIGVTLAPAPAQAYVPWCPSRCHGWARFNSHDNLHAVGTDLSVQCLHVPNRADHFVNMEMWLTTQTNRPNAADWNWVEAGMTAGTLWHSPGHERGFIWFWADMYGDSDNYYEHYISGASTNTSTNISFYWESPGWGVYKGGSKVGWSGVGAYPGTVDVGGESTNGMIAVHGRATNWQYADKNMTWRWITPLYAPTHQTGEAIRASMPGGSTVNVDSPYWACGGPAPTSLNQASSAETVRANMRTPEGARSHLKSEIARVVQQLGKADLTKATYTQTSRNTALGRHGGAKAADGRSSDVQIPGSFSKQVKDGRKVTGTVLELVIDAETGQLTDWGLTQKADSLHGLGQTFSLS